MKKILIFFWLLFPLLSCGSQKFEFAKDFPVLKDLGGYGQGQRIRGFGGIKKGEPLNKTPIILVHGNGANSDTFIRLAKLFYEAGYSRQEIWAFSYLGYPSILQNLNPHEENVEDLNQFVQAVLNYTGAKKVSLITHSLGVTLSLYWMKKFNAYPQVETFVAAAGAVHGFPGMEDIEWDPAWMNENLRLMGDETPYSKNSAEKNHVPADETRSIFYVVAEAGKDDRLINLYGPNILSPLMEGADAHYALEGKIITPLTALPMEKQCGAHCSIIFYPETFFKFISKHFL